ncbi:MAG: hypothetical protein V4805_09870 [Pseudomonadota bacterium]
MEGRYRDNGELRYLLRSIARYWTLQGQIYLVTDQQVPDFIASHPRLHIVDHQDIMPDANLPVFSSRAIEANLHRIPGIAEHFVAFNDDLFLTRSVGYEDFFGTLGAVIYLTDELMPEQISIQNFSGPNDALQASHWVAERYGKPYLNHVAEHAPKGIRTSWMRELEAQDPTIFTTTSQERFREVGGQSILANLYGHWCLAIGRATIRKNQCVYLLSDQIESSVQPATLAQSMADKLCLCINDTTGNRAEAEIALMRMKLKLLLDTLYPDSCQFEKLFHQILKNSCTSTQ